MIDSNFRQNSEFCRIPIGIRNYKWLHEMDKALKTMSYDELSNIGIADDDLERTVSVRVRQVRVIMFSPACTLKSLNKY